ncbi:MULTISPECIES: DUF4167 domain-containing protein [unclassified Mesorhizobium]|uniref:DUF4167 domain-containing protein n=1 Tax=unclassified Mesorhizobium TaxID=325217 RepID=UPI000FDC11F1|nr:MULTISPECIES: DUF4167 domain-containing protein [unclassified Mesorhizobium]TGR39920.1 DUF4167 domain-containing protein [bacterium M00.F.Ca.ET.199.01.1.1]TGU24126.1 DUF4167 domain-containing protein [bacterium M00.F.Ca.ET.156.01.1.1]TGV89339.1 DUF4167 domain-containing protein [Mesorhizobium sp. M00.F.Ca.ET.149.01.1.1]TGR23298.1 DUF4167 domain-containing protein [Mesorhizobium sp. M8A.F.Ca.ET.202.01.1.1]TGR24532.1 DUF4167 domain-containing protein [Mesorhizobium sp. M8A.F.Ca.ET.197.01.1.1]
MRPQQQNRRMRGRNNNGGGGNNNNNNNNRKGPNPLTRNYESNGPDVKIRGSAQQIAEKYATLARDAQSSGDRVMAENYLQHAEHYNRIIAAAQAQMPIQNVQQNRDEFDEDGDEDRDEFDNAGNSGAGNSGAGNSGASISTGNAGSDPQVPVVNHGAGPQPVIEGMPAEVALNRDGRDNRDNSGRDNGGRNNSGRDNNNGGRHRDRRPNGGYGQNGQRDYASAEQGGQQQRNEASGQTEVQAEPASPSETVAAAEPAPRFENFSPAGLAAQAELNEAAAESGAARRPRRPRRPRTNPDQVEGGSDNADAGETAAAPGDGGSAEPVIADIGN